MNNAVLKNIVASDKTCYFVSPHFDDMIFSSGALATELAKTNRIVVINIFTSAGTKNTLSAKTYLKQCGYEDQGKLYEDRTREDKAAIRPITNEVIDLGFREALWREKSDVFSKLFGKVLPEFSSVYPTYRFNIVKGRIAKADLATYNAIATKLQSIIKDKDAVVFCPLGIGHHIDHVITHQVCKELFTRPIFWADYPYTQHNAVTEQGTTFSFDGNMEQKAKLVAAYKTQYQAMFGASGLTLEPERFFTG